MLHLVFRQLAPNVLPPQLRFLSFTSEQNDLLLQGKET